MSHKPNILVTGADGQLGSELRYLADNFTGFAWHFHNRSTLPLTSERLLAECFSAHRFSYCINAAAYTAVDLAEQETELAFAVNATAPGILAGLCAAQGARLIHVSTDYVFDGKADKPYREEDPVSPQNVYGASKLAGEQAVMQQDPSSIIIRTSWVYSRYGKNFVKTMLRLMKERNELNVVNDQFGSPTYAADLASAIASVIADHHQPQEGVYHYANQGVISWFDFATAIRDISGLSCKVLPITTDQYPTPAKRPPWSVLDTSKIRRVFGLDIPLWKASLDHCINGTH